MSVELFEFVVEIKFFDDTTCQSNFVAHDLGQVNAIAMDYVRREAYCDTNRGKMIDSVKVVFTIQEWRRVVK